MKLNYILLCITIAVILLSCYLPDEPKPVESPEPSPTTVEDSTPVPSSAPDIPEAIYPVGTILAYGGVSDPQGWMICDGRALNRDDYPELFSVIWYTFSPAGTATFNIPDLRDRFISGTSQNESPGPGGGGSLLTLTAGQMPVHSHGVDIMQTPGHTHSYIDTYRIGSDEIDGSGSKWVAENEVENSNKTTGSAGGHTHSISIHNAGGGQPFENRPSFVKLNFIIKF